MADRIALTGLRCFGHHGVLDHEKEFGQEFIVDLVAWIDFSAAAAADDLTQTVSYADMAQRAADIVEGPVRDLIETVATEIAETLMAEFPRLRVIEVTVHKPAAPIPLRFDDVAVVARRSRGAAHAEPQAPGCARVHPAGEEA